MRRGKGALLSIFNPSVERTPSENSLTANFQLPRLGSLLVRLTSSNIKPALKGDSSRARPVGDAARGESGGIGSIASGSAARRPYSNQRSWLRVQRADGGVASGLLLFASTPQSIRLAAYCQLPGRGAFNSLSLACGSTAPPQAVAPFGAPLTKSCPRLRGKWHGEAMTKGERLKGTKSFELFPLSRLTPTAPPQAVEPFGVVQAQTKSCPRLRGKWTRSGRKGNG